MNARKPGKKAGPRPEPLTPYEMGLRDGRAALAQGERPSREALARAARILVSSPGWEQMLAAAEDDGAAAGPTWVGGDKNRF